MSSRISSLIRVFLRAQRIAQRFATVSGVRRLSHWTEQLYTVPKDVRWEKISRGEFTYEWLIPENLTSPLVLFHIHGGGFVLPLYNPERFTTAYLARLTGVRALLVDYRLAPENPFPAALTDCIEAYRWLISDAGVSPEHVVFTGESAGGNLVVTTLLGLMEAGITLPSGVVAICPVFDFEGGGTFFTQNDPMLLPSFAMMQFSAYRGSADPRNPLLSPLYADLAYLPPILVQVGENELLRSGAEEFASRAKHAGVQVTLHVWPGMWHFWHLFLPWLPEAREAMAEIKLFIHSCSPSQVSHSRHPNVSLEATGNPARFAGYVTEHGGRNNRPG
jgi:acetyl esterase/lipase